MKSKKYDNKLAATLKKQSKAKPFKIKAVSMGGPLPGINLVKANQLAADLEDEELIRKMRLGK